MVWRRLLVPDTCTMRELHGIIQVVMGRAIAYEFPSRRFNLTVVDSGGSGRIRAGLRAYPRPKFASMIHMR